MDKTKRYNIMVFKDDHATYRQFSIKKGTLKLGMAVFIFGILAAVGLVYYFASGYSSVDELERVARENEALRLANDRYLNATLEIEKKLKVFEERTAKLGAYVGVENVEQGYSGIGSADLLENELGEYLRYDLALLENKTASLLDRMDTLEQVFMDRKDVLDATPTIFPTRGWLSSGIGYRPDPFTNKRTWHNGIDISCPKGTPVYAPANGVITFRGYKGGSGNLVILNHGNELISKYAHLSGFNVSKGQRVKRGDLIAYVGNTGSRTTGPHLHFEIHKDGKAVNPLKFMIDEIKPY